VPSSPVTRTYIAASGIRTGSLWTPLHRYYHSVGRVKLLMELPHDTAVECHLPCGITYHPTRVNTPRLNPSQTGSYSIYLPQRDGRL